MLLLTLCISIHSCKKEIYDIKQTDESYNPEQKINKIYYEEYEQKYLTQEWTWENDKLMSIEYFRKDGISKLEHYNYEENKLVKVEDNGGYLQISYKNLQYDKIEYFRVNNNHLIATWIFSYINNKVYKINLTYDYSDSLIYKMVGGGFLSSLLPSEKFISMVKRSAKENGSESPYPQITTLTYRYVGNNIQEKKWTIDGTDVCATYYYKSYDNKQNPFYKHIGLMNLSFFVQGIDMVTSQNNPLELNVSYSEVPWLNTTTTYSYKYDTTSFPIELEVIRIGPYEAKNQYKEYYEYE